MFSPELIAFDFDGVICDGLIEYFQTSWEAYCQLFQPRSSEPPPGLAEKFYSLRPVIETGWEMPVLVDVLVQGVPDQDIIDQWPGLALSYLESAHLTKEQSIQTLDGVRDRWVRSDLAGWLGLHRFYPGILERLSQILNSDLPTYIVSTKESRFIKAILAQSGIDFPAARIIGKDAKRPKYETLRRLKEKHATPYLWFVEDRLPALQQVAAQNDLSDVQLFLAAWGYNLDRDRTIARHDPILHLLSQQQAVQTFEHWLSS